MKAVTRRGKERPRNSKQMEGVNSKAIDKRVSEIVGKRYTYRKDGGRWITEEWDVLNKIQIAVVLIRKILKGNNDLFELKYLYGHGPLIQATERRLCDPLVRLIEHGIGAIEDYLPENAFNPYLELLIGCINRRPALLDACAIYSARGPLAECWVKELNDLVSDLRMQGRSKDFHKELDSRRRQCDRNTQKAIEYINQLFAIYSRLTFLRIDLAYGMESTVDGRAYSSIEFKRTKIDLDEFRRYLREKMGMVGYVGTIEYGYYTGYHYHLLLVFDGHLIQQDVLVCKMHGEYWVNKVTKGEGRYFNCNAEFYQERGIGVIDRRDSEKRRILFSRVVPYLTKTDFWTRFKGVKKTFFKGLDPGEPSGLGRPRIELVAGSCAQSEPQGSANLRVLGQPLLHRLG